MDFKIYRTPLFVRWLYPGLVWHKPTKQRVIYLTFDDGPVPGVTENVLQVLAEFNAKATFFCIGDNVRKHPTVFDQVLAGGHAIGNHTFNHLKGWSTPVASYIDNVAHFNEHLATHSRGQSKPIDPPKLFRPPYGRITRAQIAALKHYEIVMWDVLSYDYDARGRSEERLHGTIKATRPGSIVVFHDSYKAQAHVEYILPRYLTHFASQGYQFHSLTPPA